jgi:hypothetical protein
VLETEGTLIHLCFQEHWFTDSQCVLREDEMRIDKVLTNAKCSVEKEKLCYKESSQGKKELEDLLGNKLIFISPSGVQNTSLQAIPLTVKDDGRRLLLRDVTSTPMLISGPPDISACQSNPAIPDTTWLAKVRFCMHLSCHISVSSEPAIIIDSRKVRRSSITDLNVPRDSGISVVFIVHLEGPSSWYRISAQVFDINIQACHKSERVKCKEI